MADQILVPPSPTRILEAVSVVQAPPVLLNVPAAANVPAPEGMTSCRFKSFSSGSSASLVAAQGGNDFPANSLAGNEPGKVNIYVNISHFTSC